MDTKLFKQFLREELKERKENQLKESGRKFWGTNSQQKTDFAVLGRESSEEEDDRTMPNFEEFSASGCSKEDWEERTIDRGEDPTTIKCAKRDQDGEEKLIWGLNSTSNPDSLKSLLLKHKPLDADQIEDLIRKIIELARTGRVPQLEEQLSGDRGEKQRVFDLKATTGLLHAIASFNLNKDVGKKLLRVLNLWGRMNTVRFESPAEKIQLWADEEPSVDDREAKLAAKEKEWDEKGLNKTMGEPIGADDEDFAGETPEKGSGDEEKPKDSVGDKEYCSDLLGALKKSNPELFDDLKFDQSVAGSLSNLANDISFSADAVALSAMAAGASFPPAGPGAIIVAGGAEIVARQAAGVAVVADLFSGKPKKAAIDAIGLIPWGKYAAKGLGKLGMKLAKTGSESSSEIIKKLAKTLSGASSSLAEKGAEGLTESLVAKMVDAGVDEATAKAAAKALTTALEQKIQNTYKTLADGAPSRDGKTEEEYREALKKYRTMKREAIDNEYKKCMTKEGTAFQQTLINFFKESDKLVDDIPRAFDSLIDAGLSFAGEGLEKIGDVYSWFEKMVGDEKAEEETTRNPKAPELPPSPAVPAGMGRRAMTRPKKSKLPPGTLRPPERLEELKRRLNEQRYRKLLKRFNI